MTVSLVTGANKGLGYEVARGLIGAGHTVYLGARDPDRGRRAADGLGGRFVQLDVTDDDSVQAAMEAIGEQEGRLDLLVNNAGISGGATEVTEITGARSARVFDTDVIGIIRVTQAALPLLRKSARPAVVNVTSGLGSFWAVNNPGREESGNTLFAVYAAAKAAVSMLTVQYAKALPGITFNAVAPGYTATDFTADLGGGQSPAEGAAVITAVALMDDAPTGTLRERDGELPF